MIQVKVIHKAFEDNPCTVALVDIPEEISAFGTTNQVLEYAYRWTNNTMGSWSRNDIEDNIDYNPNVTVVAPLNEDGLGLRSTSMGDQMVILSTTALKSMPSFPNIEFTLGDIVRSGVYKVAAVGFKEVV